MGTARALLELNLSDRQIKVLPDLLKEVLFSPLIAPLSRGQDHDLISGKADQRILDRDQRIGFSTSPCAVILSQFNSPTDSLRRPLGTSDSVIRITGEKLEHRLRICRCNNA